MGVFVCIMWCSQNNILRSLFTFLTFAYCSLPNTHTLPVSQLQSPTILKKNIKIQMEFFLFRKQWNNNNRKSNNHTKGVCLTPHHIRCRSPCHVILTPTRYVSVVMMMMIIALNNNIASNQRAVCVCVTPPTRTEKKIKSNFCAQPSPNGMNDDDIQVGPGCASWNCLLCFFVIIVVAAIRSHLFSLYFSFMSLVPRKITRHSQWKRKLLDGMEWQQT